MACPARIAGRDCITSPFHFQGVQSRSKPDFALQSINVKKRLFLAGFSGTGKSTVARLLTRRLGLTSIDTDTQIVKRFGREIDRVFAELGEPAFREAERQLVLRASAADGVVVSVGGGAIVDPVCRSAMLGSGAVVLLDASPEVILDRLSRGATEVRPMLRSVDPLARIAELRARRLNAYRCAQFTVNTDTLSPDEVADRIEAWFVEHSPGGGS
jgi:shikimate kinase